MAILEGKINLYPRKLWISMREGEKVKSTYGLAIDGDAGKRVENLKALYGIKWGSTMYKDATFVPFRATRVCTVKHQNIFFDSHNAYMETTYTKAVELVKTPMLTRKNGKGCAFVSWLEGQRH